MKSWCDCPAASTVANNLFAPSNTLDTRFPKGLMLATARLATSNTVVLVFPRASTVATGLLAASKTVEETNPRAFVIFTSRLPASNAKLVRFPSGSMLATARPA